MVASPDFLTRERKAVLIDARARIRPDDFPEYFDKLITLWEKESK